MRKASALKRAAYLPRAYRLPAGRQGRQGRQATFKSESHSRSLTAIWEKRSWVRDDRRKAMSGGELRRYTRQRRRQDASVTKITALLRQGYGGQAG